MSEEMSEAMVAFDDQATVGEVALASLLLIAGAYDQAAERERVFIRKAVETTYGMMTLWEKR